MFSTYRELWGFNDAKAHREVGLVTQGDLGLQALGLKPSFQAAVQQLLTAPVRLSLWA